MHAAVDILVVFVGPSEGSRESSAAWPSAAAHIGNSATTQRLMNRNLGHICYLQMVQRASQLQDSCEGFISMHAAVDILVVFVGPSEGSRESSAAWPSAAAHIGNSATTQRLMNRNLGHICYLQMVRPKDKLRLRAPCHAEPVDLVDASHHLKVATRQALPRRRGFLVDFCCHKKLFTALPSLYFG